MVMFRERDEQYGKMREGKGAIRTRRGMLTPTSLKSLTVSRIVTECFGLASLVDMPAERPARPQPIMTRWRDMISSMETRAKQP